MRLPRVTREELSPESQAVWDRIAANRHGVSGPYGVLIHVPKLADCERATEDYFRFDGAMSDADREIVILAPRERLLVELAHSLLRTRSLPQELFDRGLAELGRQQLVELVALVGHYTTIGYIINSFEVPLPEDATPTF
jgi:4-carboxymuconolactone decarboxylase